MAVALTIATIDLGSKALAQGAGVAARNPGLALGIVDTGTLVELMLMLLGLMAGGVWLLKRAAAGKSRHVTAALIVGGAAANLVDRLLNGGVTDFIPTPWAVLNLADLFLAAGVVLLYSELSREMRLKRNSMGEIGKVASPRHRQEQHP